jgi:hypothetical protein
MSEEILSKISEDLFIIGNYSVRKDDTVWVLAKDTTKQVFEAHYFDRNTAIRTAILLHTCGDLVQETTREFIKMLAHETE